MTPSAEPAEPVLRFYRVIAEGRPPQRADRAAGGTLPVRGARYCDAVTTASAFGWYVFAPMPFSLLFDGETVFWSYAGVDRWLPLQAVQFPNLRGRFDAAAPPAMRGCAPPFLTALIEPGVVQVWTGLIARTAPDWSLLLRAPANVSPGGGFACFEGLVETDRWFGPLFTNLRLTRTDTPVHIRADMPLLQVQALPRAVYDEATLESVAVVPGLAEFTDADWDDYHRTVVAPNDDPARAIGRYAVAVRKRRAVAERQRGQAGCPFAGAAA